MIKDFAKFLASYIMFLISIILMYTSKSSDYHDGVAFLIASNLLVSGALSFYYGIEFVVKEGNNEYW